MREKFLGRYERKRNWGRSMRIDSWDRLELVIELIKSSLPIDVRIELSHADISRFPAPPMPYDPHTGSSMTIPTPLPLLAEVRMSLCIDETLAWLLPVQFCINQLLTAEEVITKLADAFWFLQGWSQVHSNEGHEHLRTERLQSQRSVTSPRSSLVHYYGLSLQTIAHHRDLLNLDEEQFLAQYPVGKRFRMELSVRVMDEVLSQQYRSWLAG